MAFEETDAFAWLTKHAGSFGFEMSYPKGNARGFNYEPWHWRFTPR
ncbi:D-alanyl-D-alanine carboxypeptidase family protein (plasmid) [Pseudomonas silesiensis]